MVYQIKQYDDKTAMRATILSDGKPVDLTQTQEVRFLMRYRNTIVINKIVYIVDAINGKIWFPFERSETAQRGDFNGEFFIVFSDGRQETFPNHGSIPINISPSNIALTMTEGG